MIEMTPLAQFWKWFRHREPELFDFDATCEAGRERIFGEIASQLHKVDPDLTFEIGPNGTPKREFIISAGGIKRAFPAVVSLTGAAPPLERWQVTAFRPRRSSVSAVEIRGKRVDPRNVQFSLIDNGKMAGLYMFIPGFQDDDVDLKQIGYLLLDDALGEYDVESRLGLIKMLSPQTPTDGKRHPFADLPALFDRLVLRIEGRSGIPF
jgi:hypothetical protein